MSLINEKRQDIHDYKPSEVDSIVDKLHHEQVNNQREIQKKCPACKSEKYNFAFDKYSFHYIQCTRCMSLYIQNTLNENDMQKYDKILEDKLYSTDKYSSYLDTLVDKISFELELTFSRLFNKQQSLNVAYLGNKSKVYEKILKDFNIKFIQVDLSKNLDNKKYDLIIIDHYMEKTTNLSMLTNNISSLLTDNGFLFITMRVGGGIDILTLWEDSKIYPLEHNNLLSIDGIKILLDRNNLQIKELNTPGVLDIDNILATKSKEIPRFLNYLKETNNKKAIEEFQTFIQKNLLSSFATIVAQRK